MDQPVRDFVDELTSPVHKHGLYVPVGMPDQLNDLRTDDRVAYFWWDGDQQRYWADARPPETPKLEPE